MQFFLLDLALAMLALLGYRTLAASQAQPVPLASNPKAAAPRRGVEPRPVLPKHPPHDCPRRAPHRLINFW